MTHPRQHRNAANASLTLAPSILPKNPNDCLNMCIHLIVSGVELLLSIAEQRDVLPE